MSTATARPSAVRIAAYSITYPDGQKVSSATAATAATAGGDDDLAGAQARFAAFAAGQPGPVGLAIAPLGQSPVVTYGSWRSSTPGRR
ncbi:MAG: hypothetical protein ABSH51_16875 [Solirubrobacteraceae bacterium]|jgi:hypothetical protein